MSPEYDPERGAILQLSERNSRAESADGSLVHPRDEDGTERKRRVHARDGRRGVLERFVVRPSGVSLQRVIFPISASSH